MCVNIAWQWLSFLIKLELWKRRCVYGRWTFCGNLQGLLTLIGYVITAFKIVIPMLLIVFGMMDVGKAVVGSKDDEIKKSLKSFAMRAMAAVVIFFIPSIVGLIMSAVANSGGKDAEGWTACKTYLGL